MKYEHPDKTEWADDDPRQQINAFNDEQFRAIYNDWMPPEQPPLPKYDGMPGLGVMQQMVLPFIKETGGYALDIGCGNGANLISLYLNKYILGGMGIDISDAMIQNSKQSAMNNQCEGGFRFARMALEDAEFLYKYNVIIMSEVLEHFYNCHVALQKVCDTLADGGVFVGNTPLGHNCDARPHLHYFSVASLMELLYHHFEKVWISLIDVTGQGEEHLCFACKKPRRTDEPT